MVPRNADALIISSLGIMVVMCGNLWNDWWRVGELNLGDRDWTACWFRQIGNWNDYRWEVSRPKINQIVELLLPSHDYYSKTSMNAWRCKKDPTDRQTLYWYFKSIQHKNQIIVQCSLMKILLTENSASTSYSSRFISISSNNALWPSEFDATLKSISPRDLNRNSLQIIITPQMNWFSLV